MSDDVSATAALAPIELLAFILRVFRACDSFRGRGSECIWRRTDEPEYAPVTFLVNCNDTFYWATSGSEPLTPVNINVFEQAIEDSKTATRGKPVSDRSTTVWANGTAQYAPMLFCARVLGMRPMRRAYPSNAVVRALLDACGPERSPKDEG